MAAKTFSPSMGDLTLYAFQLIGLRPASLIQEHIESARMAANMVLSSWSGQGVNLWEIDLQTIPLVNGVETYDVPNDTVIMLDAYITIHQSGRDIDRVIMPISRSEYATYPNKEQPGFPTVFWFERTLNPKVHIWPVPSSTAEVRSNASLSYYRMKQIGVSDMQGGGLPEIPLYFVEAFALALAARLAAIWVPEKAAMYASASIEAYNIAAAQNVETADYYISPSLSGYYR
jgi:hypothetical protein